MISRELIEDIRTRTDIVELIGSYVPLKRAGRSFRGLCPFHPDRSPSFFVSPERQSYHCFGCGAGGTAISFLMAIEKLEFPDAVRELGRRLGIEVRAESGSGRNQALYDACELAAAFFEAQLQRSRAALDYLQRRGIGEATRQRFRLGFAPAGNMLRAEARRRGVAEDVMIGAGLLARRDTGTGDYFFNRLMFPIFSLSGRVIAFGGRVLDDSEPKYLNSPETPVYRKGAMLYGLYQARAYLREGLPILVEGNFDLLSLVENGINNVVAPLGTALTPDQAALLRRYNSRVLLLFDGDSAGRAACRRSIDPLLRADIEPLVVQLPDGEDPDSFVRRRGRPALTALLERPQDFVVFVAAGRHHGVLNEQRQAVRELAELIRGVPDEATRQIYANRVAAVFDIDRHAVLADSSRTTRPAVRQQANVIDPAERLVAAAVRSAELARIADELGLAETIVDPALKTLTETAARNARYPGYSAATVMDEIADDALRRRVAQWTFDESALPSAEEYRARIQRRRAKWLQELIARAQRENDEATVERLVSERQRLLQTVARKE